MMCLPGVSVQLPHTEVSRAEEPGTANGYLVAITSSRIASRRRAPFRDQRMPRRLKRRFTVSPMCFSAEAEPCIKDPGPIAR